VWFRRTMREQLATILLFASFCLLPYGRTAIAFEDKEAARIENKETVAPRKPKKSHRTYDEKRAANLVSPLLQETIGLFSPCEYQYAGGQNHEMTLPYRLYSPPNLVEGNQYPLVVWLHGAGESGRDNWGQLRHMDMALKKHKGKFPAFILVPQINQGVSWYKRQGIISPNDMLTVTWSLMKKIIREYPIDEDRIPLVGISSGGSACWEMGMRYPDRFCAIAPISSGGGDIFRIANLVKTPVWAFHNIGDEGTPIAGVRRTTEALQAAGGQVYLLERDASGHDGWRGAFTTYDLFSWLLAKRQGDEMWSPQEEKELEVLRGLELKELKELRVKEKLELKKLELKKKLILNEKRKLELKEWLLNKTAPLAGIIGVIVLLLFACFREAQRQKSLALNNSEGTVTEEVGRSD